ncbi:TetR/AcrR family transcriptional regulator [Microlunatus panaciterrae]|uniref:AcrR family transcriptional regulator n=1 Tax=Microlunatus panaciterrae TaxID=400768 RepID=A0ABS2RJD6_9ACTN|nr:AcrR family transcriptional regulator [Microlunatus panaciterrae]
MEVSTKNEDRVSRRRVDKFAERRAELADAALQTLAELGYARTSLREIAQNSEFSHGVLHYYFTDKADLITFCVRRYKTQCVARYDDILAGAATADELRDGFAGGLAVTLREDATMHRLWYDLRNQSLFDPAFSADVRDIDQSLQRMIWRIVDRYAELSRDRVLFSPETAYAVIDGLFHQAQRRQLAGDDTAAKHLEAEMVLLLPRLLTSCGLDQPAQP